MFIFISQDLKKEKKYRERERERECLDKNRRKQTELNSRIDGVS